MGSGNERVVVAEHPLVEHKLSILRDKNTPSWQFRQLVREISLIEGYEAARFLQTKPVSVLTPVAMASCRQLSETPVIVPILRAGLGLLEGMLDLIPSASVGHLGMERDENTHAARSYYSKMPEDVKTRPVIIVDPMLATGGSAVSAIKHLRALGVSDLTLMVMVSAPEGIQAVLDADPDVRIVTCAIDEGLNENAYIVPGLGDAGDRIFGTV